jgi:hypothetical protein
LDLVVVWMGNAGYEGVVSANRLGRDSGLEYFFVRTESVCIRFLDAGGTDLKQISVSFGNSSSMGEGFEELW